MATKAHVILRSYVKLTQWVIKKTICVTCDIMEQHKVNFAIMTMMWCVWFDGISQCQNPWYMGVKPNNT